MPDARARANSGSDGSRPQSVSFFNTARASDPQPYDNSFGSTRSLPAYGAIKRKALSGLKFGRGGGMKRAESYPDGQWPVYMDDKVMRQVRENTSKFIQQRITNVEKHFGDLCQGLGNYLRRLSKVRDAGDDLAKFLMTYAEKETFNSSTKESLVSFAAHFAAVQDYEDCEIQRLDNKVLGPLTVYGTECKHAKEKLKQAFAARNKEIKEAKNVNKAKANPSNQRGLSQAETDLQKASVDATRASKQLENEMDAFERRKLDDIKRIFLDFVNIKMLYHARALEMYTQCYQSISHMSEDTDLEEFRSSLRPPSSQGRLDHGAGHGSRTSLNTTGISSSATVPSAGKSTPSTTPANVRRRQLPPDTPTDTLNTTNRTTSMYSETQDEDYDDEDDEDEYEDEDDDDEEESENDTYAQRFRRK